MDGCMDAWMDGWMLSIQAVHGFPGVPCIISVQATPLFPHDVTIVLHYITSYLKSKTAKPLCTVLQMKNNEKVNMEKNMSFETFPENVTQWSGGDVTHQEVSETATNHRKCTVTDGGKPCILNHQLQRWQRLETAMDGVGNSLNVVRQILWYIWYNVMYDVGFHPINTHTRITVGNKMARFLSPMPMSVSVSVIIFSMAK